MIGRLRQRVNLLAETRTADGFGGFTLSWTNLADLWADVEERGGSEDAPAAGKRVRITLRLRGGVKPSMRFGFGARVFEIVSALERDGRWLVCDCIERIVE